MTPPSTGVWLLVAYSLGLLAVAWGFDLMAKRVSFRAAKWRTGNFTYHPDHDAWQCPQDQLLWPTSFDPDNRVMRYRAKPSVCNSCPVKADCTTSEHGREITREVDPWPYSEAGQFHRGIACAVAGLALVMVVAMLIAEHSAADTLVLVTTGVLIAAGTIPLARHLWRNPANAPNHLPHHSGAEAMAALTADRFATSWGGDYSDRRDQQREENP